MTMHAKSTRKQPTASALKKNLAELRQFALMSSDGLASQLEGMAILNKVVPHENAVLLTLDAECNAIDLHQKIELPVSIPLDYLHNFMNKGGINGEGVTGMTITQCHRSGLPLIDPSRLRDERIFGKSEFYNRVLIAAQLGWYEVVVMRKTDGTPLAQCMVGRALGSRNYSDAEHKHLQMAQPWLEHIARQSSRAIQKSDIYLPDDQSATMIINTRGDILHTSDMALSLLRQAANIPLSDAKFRQGTSSNIARVLGAFGKVFIDVMRGQKAFVPSHTTTNHWGRFSLRAYSLKNTTGDSVHIALHIEKFLPLNLKMFKSAKFMSLTLRERDVCIHLLANLSHTEIATKLGIKPSSVVYHTKNIYAQLGIQARHGLLDTLLGQRNG